MNSLDQALSIAPILTKILKDEDFIVAITDTEKFIYASPGKNLDPGIEYGQPFLDDDLFGKIKKTLKRVELLTPPGYGSIPFKGIGYPLFDENNNWIGSLGFGISLQKEYILNDIITNLNKISGTIGEQTQNITAHAEELSAMIEEISSSSETTMHHTEEMSNVISFIESVTQQSNLLGLNASIEAARAGEYGKTFSVVATEIRKLSSNTGEASQKISAFLGEMKEQIMAVTQSIRDIEKSSAELNSNAETFSKVTEELNQLSETLNSFMSGLLKQN
ncbi:methyl-accepting chemotaxis protein [Lysinibacillus telephonicus]|uniref:Methyl-accepting transducer domain-containing protein n=1 Tax=Lysinibacillus telephonicus TaxID=1714840 RepID=A0A3S0HP38_9BACI|nr:methyl-accepting chemotaxis protein [Lysinibacillus telephonicus]RTQ94893.1 hypothetical protein EKG35_04385 [Lysinibacillus telephonicus]